VGLFSGGFLKRCVCLWFVSRSPYSAAEFGHNGVGLLFVGGAFCYCWDLFSNGFVCDLYDCHHRVALQSLVSVGFVWLPSPCSPAEFGLRCFCVLSMELLYSGKRV